MNRERYLVVVPTYNERENVARVVPQAIVQDPRIHVLVVDDDSPDGTGEVADRMAERDHRVHVLHRRGKKGLGGAYVEGFRWGLARDYALFFEMDADLSHPPEHLPEFIDEIQDADVVIGSRYMNGRVTVVNWPIHRLLLSYFGTVYARTITGLPVSDATGGYNCFRREVLMALGLDRIESDGYAFQIELKLRAWRRGFRIQEIPIVFTERDTGESKMSGRIVREAVWRVWQLRFLDMLGKL
ncbi:MAG: polyprenol monophosphomannose synthase [Longimicrobiales bacterium]